MDHFAKSWLVSAPYCPYRIAQGCMTGKKLFAVSR